MKAYLKTDAGWLTFEMSTPAILLEWMLRYDTHKAVLVDAVTGIHYCGRREGVQECLKKGMKAEPFSVLIAKLQAEGGTQDEFQFGDMYRMRDI